MEAYLVYKINLICSIKRRIHGGVFLFYLNSLFYKLIY